MASETRSSLLASRSDSPPAALKAKTRSLPAMPSTSSAPLAKVTARVTALASPPAKTAATATARARPGGRIAPPPPGGRPGPGQPPPPPPADGPIDPPADEPVDPPADEPIDPPADEPIDEPIDEPADPPADPRDDFRSFAPAPANNPTTEAKVELGRLLFWDPILSGNNDVSCATCHNPNFGYADAIPLSIGVGGRGLGPQRVGNTRAGRNSPTVLNTGLNGWIDEDIFPRAEDAPMFWDIRARSLEEQALGPIANAEEMRGDAYPEDEAIDVVVGRLAAIPEYVTLFAAAFDVDPDEAVTATHLARAIGAFERHLSTPDSAFDRWLAGDDDAMTPQQIRGFDTFRRVGCDRCHTGPMFSDYRLRRIGAPNNTGNATDDGDGTFRFRTASLRNIGRTAPYMHGGTFANLTQVFAFYRRPGTQPPRGQGVLPANIGPLDRDVLGLRFNGQDEADMATFLASLTDITVDTVRPAAVPSGLPVGGR